MEKYDGILNDGQDYDVSRISNCNSTLDKCEKGCPRYYSCDTVAMAEDILKEYEFGKKKRLYFDMDGVLAKWQEGTPIETVCSPGYFANLPAEQNVVEALKLLAVKERIELHILSAVFDEPHNIADKLHWIKNNLGDAVKPENIHFVSNGTRKSLALGGIDKNDILIDDYSKNISDWIEDGGTTIKMFNATNGRTGKYYGSYTCTWLAPCQIADDILAVVLNNPARASSDEDSSIAESRS